MVIRNPRKQAVLEANIGFFGHFEREDAAFLSE
jgi:hypothetical protein